MTLDLAEHAPIPVAGPSPPAVDGNVLKDWRRRFWLINRERLRRIHQVLNPNQRRFLDILPLLFHINYPLLPGYVGKLTPAGVAEYSPDKNARLAARREARSFDCERRAAKSIDIYALYLMGSSGTVAYSRNSDFDIWVCHRPGLTPELREELRRKAKHISGWAASLGLEVHFFNMVAEEFRDGEVTALSSESSGSAQRYLLLDEFYRTGLLVAGRFPIWWLVPPEREHDYAAHIQMLTTKRFVRAQEFVDFGPVSGIPAAEFLGATLWHLTKAIRSPHKSLLKIILLEAYATEFPDIELLSLRFKRAVQMGELKLDNLDPYVAFGSKIEDYLLRSNDRNRLELARRSFYFKVNEPLGSTPAPRADNWRRDLIQEIVDEWGWVETTLRALDARRSWKIDRVVEERKDLVNALMHSYRLLSRFAREHAVTAMVSERDMTILGRQLFAVFEHKAGKVDVVNQGLSNDLSEGFLSIHSLPARDDQDYWVLYRGTVAAGEEPDHLPLKRARTLMELIAWCHFNGVIARQTRLTVNRGRTQLTTREVETVLSHLRAEFPPSIVDGAGIDDFARAPEMVRASTFVNLGVDPMEKYTRQGKSLASAQIDALCYGGLRENLVRDVEYLVVTSWREILTFKFQGIDGLMACLCEHLKWIPPDRTYRSGRASCQTFTPGYTQTISQRMSELFSAVTTWFLDGDRLARKRYVLQGEERYYVLLSEEGVVRHDFRGDYGELLKYLAKPNPRATAVTIDRAALNGTALPLVFDSAPSGAVRCAFQVVRGEAMLYIVDETGSLFCDTYPFYSEATLVNHLNDFFESVQYRQVTSATEARHDPPRAPIEFFRIAKGTGRELCLRLLGLAPASPQAAALNVQVIGELVNGEPEFTLYCDGREFSTLEYGDRVFEALSHHMLSRRTGRARYRLYINDIDLSRLPVENAPEEGSGTVRYLHYKKHIERQLNAAVAGQI